MLKVFEDFTHAQTVSLKIDVMHWVSLSYICYWYIAPQMEHSFSFFKILNEGFFTLKICMRIDVAKPYLDLNFGRD